MLDVLGLEYGFTKPHCLYTLSLPDILNYVGARNERLRLQNDEGADGDPPEKAEKIETVEDLSKFFGGFGLT